jgi:hypothetical protein
VVFIFIIEFFILAIKKNEIMLFVGKLDGPGKVSQAQKVTFSLICGS